MNVPIRIITEQECLPPALPALYKPEDFKDEHPPTEAEALEALKAIGATTTPESVFALQTVGLWASKIKMPQMLLGRTFRSLAEVDRCKEMARTLMAAASGRTEMGNVEDIELGISATKIMLNTLAEERAMQEAMQEFYDRSQPEKKATGGANTLRPVNHFHVHQVPKPTGP